MAVIAPEAEQSTLAYFWRPFRNPLGVSAPISTGHMRTEQEL